MNITDAFESYMHAAYTPELERDTAQWRECQRAFMAGVHLTACAVKGAKDPRGKSLQIAAATMAYADSVHRPS